MSTLFNRIKSKLKNNTSKINKDYYRRFEKYSFVDCECDSLEQFEASITRLYHTIEKGLSYEDYRPGFGKDNVDNLLTSLEQYEQKGYDTQRFCYQTAVSCLQKYVKKNKDFGHEESALESRINALSGNSNGLGGVIEVSAPVDTSSMNYRDLVSSRHSIRHFSEKSVDVEVLKEAISLAQHTPSACNRQCWKTRIVADKDKMKTILDNQNGNRGFGHEFNKILVITADLRSQQRSREVFGAFVDGGMYAESVLNALYYKGIGSVPLSAALLPEQELNIRKALQLNDAEVLIMFIGVGNYPEGTFLTTRSERKPAEITLL